MTYPKNHPLDFSTLALLEQHEYYCRFFMDLELWEPFVRWVCKQNALTCRQVRSGLAGTCPTFIVDDGWVVKFFGRLFEGEVAFRVEGEAARLVSQQEGIHAPALLAEGQLLSSGEDWHWPYLVFEFIPGVSLGEVFNRIFKEDRLRIAAELGEMIYHLHHLPVGDSPVFQPDWSAYQAFLNEQRQACVTRHREWGRMPAHLIQQIDPFLLSPDHWISDHDGKPHLIHADLTRDHLLGKLEQGEWHTGGLIDFGDAMTGDLYYELAALHLDLFHGDKKMLKRFLETYGSIPVDDRFVRKAMTAALLHQFDVIGPLFERLPHLRAVPKLEELAALLWDVHTPDQSPFE
jgi:hygromycin-B 7''-O-kinase